MGEGRRLGWLIADEKYNQTGVNSLLLVRRKNIIVSMRSDRIVKTVNASEKTVI